MTEEKRENLKKQLYNLSKEEAKNFIEGKEEEIEENKKLQNLIMQALKEDDPVRYERERIEEITFLFYVQVMCENRSLYESRFI